MKKVALLLCFIPTISFASEIQFNFKSPSFSGSGFSAHVLTIENQEHTRKQKIIEDKKAAALKAAQDAKNTNLAKFLNNLESRIYATLSQKIAEELFKDNGATSGEFSVGGNNIQWRSDGQNIHLRIVDSAGSVTEIAVPYGSLAW